MAKSWVSEATTGTALYTVPVNHENASELEYTITSGNESGAFAIDGNGQVTIADEGLYPNFTTMDLVVRVSDRTESQDITINLVNNVVPDFSDVVDAEIGSESGLDTVESKLALWFDASNADSIDKDANYRISQWKDLSGNGHHISQDTAGDRPLLVDKIINNKAMIQFHNDGGEYFDQINTGETVHTLFFVYWPDEEIVNTSTESGGTGFGGVRLGNGNRALWLGAVTGSYDYELIGINNGVPMSGWLEGQTESIPNNVPQIIAVEYDGSKMNIFLNGELKTVSPRGGNHASPFEIDEFQFGLPSGSTNFLNGYVGEFIVFDESIGDEFENVHAYLAKKWGIQATVDSDNDGVADASDAYPVDATKSFDAPDFSEVVGAVINADNADATGLAAVEGNLALWLDAANLNGLSNAGVNDGDAISSWMDLSGNENHAIESDTSKMPTIDNDVFNNMKSIKFDGSNDQLKLTQRALLGENYTLFIVAQSLAANQESGSLLTQYNSAYNSGIGRGGFYSYQDKVGFWMGGYSGKYTSPVYGVADPFL